jgi:hypothetical protein
MDDDAFRFYRHFDLRPFFRAKQGRGSAFNACLKKRKIGRVDYSPTQSRNEERLT